ncbi:MAG: hypothetical protein HPY44_17240 [Armatimonadetes bacterium]|nr:hypothetical protein [Armatimonadota bacterium]
MTSVRILAALALIFNAGQAMAQTPPPPPTIPYLGEADLNGDAALDGKDMALFFAAWISYHHQGALTPKADFDENGAIDHADAEFMIQEWIKVSRFAWFTAK